MSAQQIDHLLVLSTQPPDSVENWQVSLACPVLFKTLPSTYPNASIRSYAPRERVNQSGLADARLSCNKHYLTSSAEHLLKPASHPRQRLVAPDDTQR